MPQTRQTRPQGQPDHWGTTGVTRAPRESPGHHANAGGAPTRRIRSRRDTSLFPRRERVGLALRSPFPFSRNDADGLETSPLHPGRDIQLRKQENSSFFIPYFPLLYNFPAKAGGENHSTILSGDENPLSTLAHRDDLDPCQTVKGIRCRPRKTAGRSKTLPRSSPPPPTERDLDPTADISQKD